MPAKDYDKRIGRTPEDRERAARTLDHVGRLLDESNGVGIFAPSFPQMTDEQRGKIKDVTEGDQ